MKEANGELCVEVVSAGENPWDVQLADHDLTLEQGQRYRVELLLRASAPTKVRLKSGQQTPPYPEYWVAEHSVGPEPLRVEAEFTQTGEPIGGGMAVAVQMAGPLVQTLPVTVCVQHASLVAVDTTH